MPNRIIDEMPTMSQVGEAAPYQVVCWYHYLRPTMFNDELVIVKAIARRYHDDMNAALRFDLVVKARKEFTL